MTNTNRDEVKNLAGAIEKLAHEVQVLLDRNDNIILVANELARKSNTFVFTLGGMFALNELAVSNKVKHKTTASGKPRNFHNLRDKATGKFICKV